METRRQVFLTFPQKLIREPILYNVGKRFEVIPNIRGASVTDEIGLVALELVGKEEEIGKAIQYFTSLGVKVEPIAQEDEARVRSRLAGS
jgi:ABC-type methionine transport system ATPase subunit